MRNIRHSGLVVAGFALLAGCLARVSAHAQAQVGPQSPGANNIRLGGFGDWGNTTPKGPAQRTLSGIVKDSKGEPVKGALVYLKSDREKATRSMLTDSKGEYRFVQLSRTAEYRLWAQEKDKKSPEKAVSSFETKDDITRDLRIE